MKKFIVAALMISLMGAGPVLAAEEAETGSASSGIGPFVNSITDHVELSGVVEVEAGFAEDYGGNDTSDIVLATVELGIEAQVTDWVSGGVLFLYEEGEEDDHVIVDEATITLGNMEVSPGFLTAGKFCVPFGAYETNMVSDPLTLELGETCDTAVLVGFETAGFYGSAYTYNGDVSDDDDDKIDTFGASAGFALENDSMAFGVGADWTNNIGDSDALGDTLSPPIVDMVAGVAVHGSFTAGPFSLLGEYVTALDEFESGDFVVPPGMSVEPSAFMVEAAFTTELGGRETTFAVGYQGTDEAVDLELAEERYLAAVSVGIFENTTLALEYIHDEDYSVADGGTGNDANALTVQLAVEF